MKSYYKSFYIKLSSIAAFTGYSYANYYLFKENVKIMEKTPNLDYIVY